MPFIIPTIIEKKKEIEGTEFTFALHIIKEYETEEDASDEEKGEFKRSEIYLIRSDGSNILLSVEPNQLSAMTSLAYNIGINRFADSSVRKNFDVGDFKKAADSFLLYNKARKDGKLVVIEGLNKRRKLERELFLK